MSKQPPTAHTARAIGPCPTIIQIVGRPGTGSLPRTIAPPDHPLTPLWDLCGSDTGLLKQPSLSFLFSRVLPGRPILYLLVHVQEYMECILMHFAISQICFRSFPSFSL